MNAIKLTIASLLLAVTGCASYPTFKLAPEQAHATLRPIEGGEWLMCHSGTYYTLKAEPKTNIIKLPVGKTLMLANYVSINDGNTIHTCMPALSFKPETTQVYMADVAYDAAGCVISIAQVDPERKTGLTMVESATVAHCPK